MPGLKLRQPRASAGLPVVAGLSDQAKAFQRAGKAPSTKRAYASDFAQFSA